MERAHLWEGYNGEFSKYNNGTAMNGTMKPMAYGLSQMASAASNLLEGTDRVHEQTLRIALARVNPDNYKPRMSTQNLEVTGCIENMVYKGNLKKPGEETVKVVIKQLFCSEEDAWKIRDILIHLSCDRIELLMGAFYDHGTFLVTELTLGSWDTLRRPVTSLTTLKFGIQLLESLQWLHAHRIIHCAVNPQNCLIKASGNFCLANFKEAVILKEGYQAVEIQYLRNRSGYNDPDSFESHQVNQLSDVFAAACTIFQMETGQELSDFSSFVGRQEDDYSRAWYLLRLNMSYLQEMLEMMVGGREQRSDATDILTNSTTKRLMHFFGLDFDTLNVCRDPIQCNLNVDENDKEFVQLDEQDEASRVLGYLAIGGIYYDIQDGSFCNDLVAKEDELVRFLDENKQEAWLVELVHPELKTSDIKRVAQRRLGKRIPKGLKKVITREVTKINLRY